MNAAQNKAKSTGTADTVEAIDREIRGLQARLGQIQGTKAEVYSRIVGYYRSVKNWNAGKREEYGERKMFDIGSKPRGDSGEASGQCVAEETLVRGAAPVSSAEAVPGPASDLGAKPAPRSRPPRVLLFTRKTCPNCPPAKRALASRTEFKEVDVDTQEGRAQASRLGIYATPTALVFDDEDKEVARLCSVTEINAFFTAGAERPRPAGAGAR